MGFDITKIFLPSIGVDIIFNMNSQAPYSRSSIIYDTDFKHKTITIAQPLIPFSKNTTFKELHLTTIRQDKSRRMRIGIECTHLNLIDKYTLAGKTNVSAVLLKYELPVKETNIRSAFRLPLSTKYIIKGKIIYNDIGYQTPRDFSIRDISLTGIGILVPQKRNDRTNPLTEIKVNEAFTMGIILINMDQDKPVGTLPIKAQIKRINPDFSSTHTLAGLKITTLKHNDETILNKFIHDAQIQELKRLSRRDL